MRPRLQRFESNQTGRDYAVGDVHGCFGLLDSLLAHVDFDAAVDRLFSVGDLIDRGPDSDQAGEWLVQPWFHAIRGNHELMLLDAVRSEAGRLQATADAGLWIANGGDWFFQLDPVRQTSIQQAVGQLPWAMQVAGADGTTVALIHADVIDDGWRATRQLLAADNGSDSAREQLLHLVWSRDRARAAVHRDKVAVQGIDRVLFGHTPMQQPLAVSNTRWLDTGAVFGGYLSLAELFGAQRVWSICDGAAPVAMGWTGF